jgi:hypothetical protein
MTGTNLLNATCVIPKAICYHELATQYNDNGQLIKEVLVREPCEFWLPKEFRDQIPSEQRESALEQIRARMGARMANNAERSYV